MAFQVTGSYVQEAYVEIMRIMRSMYYDLQHISNNLAVNGSNYEAMKVVFTRLQRDYARLEVLKTTDGLPQYAKNQIDDQAYEIVSEFTTTQASLATLIQEFVTAMPTGTGGYALGETWRVASGVVQRDFTVVQLAGIKTAIDTFLATLA